MIRKIFAAMMAIVGISSLSGCVPNMTAAYVYCEVEAPITWSTKDTDQTIAEVKSIRLTGFLAWLAWLGVHLVYIIGFKSRLTTLISWLVSFIGRGRPERTITAQQVIGRRAIERLTEIEAGEQDPAASPRRAG